MEKPPKSKNKSTKLLYNSFKPVVTHMIEKRSSSFNTLSHQSIVNACVIFIFFAIITLPEKSFSQQTLYNNSYSIACHNCYEKKYSKSINEVLSYTSTIELDLWDMPLLFNKSGEMENDWYVKHTLFEKGNENSFGGSLANCLSKIADWSSNNPNHSVLTIFLDKKQAWSGKKGSRKPQDLDKLILSIFGKEKVYTPTDFVGASSDLRSAVKKYHWVSLNSLKGKIVFIITDATFFKSRNIILNKYLQKVKDSAVCFVAPTIKKKDEIIHPKGISDDNVSNIIFYNLNFKNSGLCENISSNNYVNRVFRSPETVDLVNNLTEKKVNFVALFNYKLNGKLHRQAGN
jgi:hypothetical protein